MKLLIDLLGAPAHSGGMRAYSEELVRSWTEEYPADELILVGDDWVQEFARELPNVRSIAFRQAGAMARISRQLLQVPKCAWISRCDGVLSVSPVVSPLVPADRRFVIVHDWRHLSRPEEFPLLQRAYRRLWPLSVRTACHAFAISSKTEKETRSVTGKASILAPSGRDHSRRWPHHHDPHPGNRVVVAFGHHSNKRPELMIEAMSMVEARALANCKLVVLGASGAYRDELGRFASQLGILDYCVFPGFVADDQYQALIQHAHVVALVSSDEGFGLPIPEAQHWGAHVLVTFDSNVAALHPSPITEVPARGEALARELERLISSPRANSNSGSAATQRWADTVAAIRQPVASQLKSLARHRTSRGQCAWARSRARTGGATDLKGTS